MRLLFDEQLAEGLCDLLQDIFPDSLHVRLIGLGGADDERIWLMARDGGCLLVTKDEDFHRLSVLRGAPPKVVWIRIGNCATSDIAALLREHRTTLQLFAEQDAETVLELSAL